MALQQQEIPEFEQVLQRVSQRGGYILLSVVRGRTMDGFIRFHHAPGWLERNTERLLQSRAVIVALDIESHTDRQELSQLVNIFRRSQRFRRKHIFAVPTLIDNANLIRDNQRATLEVLASGVDAFLTQIDDGLFTTIEVALIRTGVLNNLQQELEAIRNQMDYLHWQWIPSQAYFATAIPDIDPTLEEQADGSVGDLRFIRHLPGDLGFGVFGMVHEARTPTGQTLAVKVMRKDNAPTIRQVERIYREIHILSSLPRHPNLVRLRFVLHSLDTIYICLAFGGPTNLYHLQRRQPNRAFGFGTAKEFFGQIADAVGHMHQHLIFHRDIKPENVAIDGTDEHGYRSMLVDLGLAVNSERPLRQKCGSLPFAAPEIMDEPCRYLGGPADAFALGMLLFELVRGQSSMENELGWTRQTQPSPHTARQLRDLLTNGPPNVNRERNEPHEVGHLLSGLLQVDPAMRINLGGVLRSPWLSTAVHQ